MLGDPDPAEDRLLVRAVAGSGVSAVRAAQEWVASVDLDSLGHDQQRVLPLVYRILLDAGITGLPARLKGVYRHSWARNTVRARTVSGVARLLDAGGVPTMVVKGMALFEHYGGRWGARDMYDADLLVRTADAGRAFDQLSGAGWALDRGATRATLDRRLFSRRSAWPVLRDDVEIDLHWHLFHTSLGARADDDTWDAADSFVLDGWRLLRPHPADLVLHVCEQGAVDAGGARLVCASDLAAITRHVGVDEIASRLGDQARRHCLVERVERFLEFVAAAGSSDAISELARQVGQVRPARVERALARLLDEP